MGSRGKAIKTTNQITQKEVVIKENERITIKTVDDKKISGRFNLENYSIIINNERIEITDIEYLKRNPLFISILTTSLLIYVGAVTLGFGALIGVLADTAFLLAIPAAGMIYAGIKSPNFLKKHKTGNNLVFEMITLSELNLCYHRINYCYKKLSYHENTKHSSRTKVD